MRTFTLLSILLLFCLMNSSAYSQGTKFEVVVNVGKKQFSCSDSHFIRITPNNGDHSWDLFSTSYSNRCVFLFDKIERDMTDTIFFAYAPFDYFEEAEMIKMPFCDLYHISLLEVWIKKYKDKTYTISYDILLKNGEIYQFHSPYIPLKDATKLTKWLLRKGYRNK